MRAHGKTRRDFLKATGLSTAAIAFSGCTDTSKLPAHEKTKDRQALSGWSKMKQLCKTDVLVVGGGPAGIGAALGAARAGVKTMLIEHHAFFGGVASWCLGMPINQMRPGSTPRSKVHELIIEKLVAYGDQAVRFGEHQLWCNVDYLKVAVLDALDEVGCNYLVHTRAVDAVMEAHRVVGVVIATKEGPAIIGAKAVVDCTGDADVVYCAGAETMKEVGSLSPITLCLNLTNVTGEQVRKAKVKKFVDKAREKYPLIPKNWHLHTVANSSSFYINHAGTRDIGQFDATDPFERSKAECISRRKFLRSAIGTAATAIGMPYIVNSTVLGQAGTVEPSNRIAMAFIGLGIQGTGLMRAFLGHKDVQVVAVCDVYESQRQKAKGIVDEHYGSTACVTYNDFREVCARKDIDAVCVATPDHWHIPVSLEAARAGKDMYTEKALGLSLTWDKALQEACNRYARVFQWGTQQRSGRNFRYGCELVRNGRIGKLHTILVGVPHDFAFPNQPTQAVPEGLDYDMWLGPAPWAPYTYQRCRPWTREESYSIWYHISDYCLGGIGGYWGVHHVDIAQWGHGTDGTGPIEIEGAAEFPEDGLADCATSWKVYHRYADGVTMIYMDNKQHKQGVTFQGTEGWIHVSRSGIWAEPESLLTSVIHHDEIHLIESKNHQRNFLDAVKTRDKTICPIDVAVRTDTICHLTDICTRLGRKLRWDPEKEDFVNDSEASRMLTRAMRSPWHL